MKLVVSVNVLPNYISDLLFLVSCLLQFSSLCSSFSVVHEHRLLGEINMPHVLHIVIKPSIQNNHNKFFIALKRDSFKIYLQIWRLSKIRTGDFGNF